MSIGERRSDIQGLRAVAVLAVVAFHAGLPLPGGFSGVDVFFVISGYVILAMLLRRWQSTEHVGLCEFYARRFRRLMPALALMVSVVVLLSIPLLSPFGPQQVVAWTALGSILLSANVAIAATSGGYFDQAAVTNPLLNTWSLSVEEQFYLAFPFILLAAISIGRTRPRKGPVGRTVSLKPITGVITGLTVASFALAIAANDLGVVGGNEVLTGFYSPFSRAWEFGLGALLALLAVRGRVVPARLQSWAGACGAVLIGLGFLLLDEELRYPGILTLLPTLGASLLIAAGVATPTGWLLSRRPVVKLGDWSYSIYLWHWPVIAFAALLFPGAEWALILAALGSFLPAIASYRWVENPLRFRSWGSRRRSGLLVLTIVGLPTVLAGALLFGSTLTWGRDEVRSVSARPAVEHLGFIDCMSFTSMGGNPAMRKDLCSFNTKARGTPLYLVGDSNAAHLSEAVVDAGKFLQRPVWISTAAGCPYMDLHRRSKVYDVGADAACRAYYVRTMNELEDRKPGIVVIGHSIGYWTDASLALGLDQMPGDDIEGPSFEVASEGLARAVVALRRAGHEVILVKPALTFLTDGQSVSYDKCTTIGLLLNTCPFAIPVSEADSGQRSARDSIDDVASKTGAFVIDLLDRQCPEGICRAHANGLPVYSDATHYSPEFSASLAGLFAEIVNELRN